MGAGHKTPLVLRWIVKLTAAYALGYLFGVLLVVLASAALVAAVEL